MPTEANLVGVIQKSIAARWPRAWQFKVVGNPYQMSGVPDLLVVVDGLLFGLEVKIVRPGESTEHARSRATSLQLSQIARIERAGGCACVVVSVDEAMRAIDLGLERRR